MNDLWVPIEYDAKNPAVKAREYILFNIACRGYGRAIAKMLDLGADASLGYVTPDHKNRLVH